MKTKLDSLAARINLIRDNASLKASEAEGLAAKDTTAATSDMFFLVDKAKKDASVLRAEAEELAAIGRDFSELQEEVLQLISVKEEKEAALRRAEKGSSSLEEKLGKAVVAVGILCILLILALAFAFWPRNNGVDEQKKAMESLSEDVSSIQHEVADLPDEISRLIPPAASAPVAAIPVDFSTLEQKVDDLKKQVADSCKGKTVTVQAAPKASESSSSAVVKSPAKSKGSNYCHVMDSKSIVLADFRDASKNEFGEVALTLQDCNVLQKKFLEKHPEYKANRVEQTQ